MEDEISFNYSDSMIEALNQHLFCHIEVPWGHLLVQRQQLQRWNLSIFLYCNYVFVALISGNDFI